MTNIHAGGLNQPNLPAAADSNTQSASLTLQEMVG
jgi:hypothetical protein